MKYWSVASSSYTLSSGCEVFHVTLLFWEFGDPGCLIQVPLFWQSTLVHTAVWFSCVGTCAWFLGIWHRTPCQCSVQLQWGLSPSTHVPLFRQPVTLQGVSFVFRKCSHKYPKYSGWQSHRKSSKFDKQVALFWHGLSEQFLGSKMSQCLPTIDVAICKNSFLTNSIFWV